MALTLITNERFQKEREIRDPETALVEYYGSEKAQSLKATRAAALKKTDWAEALMEVRLLIQSRIGAAATRELFEHQAAIAKTEEELGL